MADSGHLRDLSESILNIVPKRLNSNLNLNAVLTISIKSGLAFTHKGSVGVRAGSIHVTRVISFTFVNI